MKQNNIIYFKFPWDNIGITTYYSSKHKGIDNAGTVSGKTNKYAYLPCDAKIITNKYASDYGYFIEYAVEDERGKFIIGEGHFAKQSPLKVGETYKMGTISGEIGNTGNSKGKHDHFQMKLNNKAVDPLKYLYVYDDQFVHKDDKTKVKYFKDVKQPENAVPKELKEAQDKIKELEAEIKELKNYYTIFKIKDFKLIKLINNKES